MKSPVCNICKEEYTDDSGCRVPKTLDCAHTICLECARISVINNGIVCSLCRMTTPLGPQGALGLKNNFGLLEVITDSQTSEDELGTQQSPPRCAAHPYNLAEFVCLNNFCESADKLMCRTCEEYGVHKGHDKGLLQEECASLRKLLEETDEILIDREKNLLESKENLQNCWLAIHPSAHEYMAEKDRIIWHFRKIRRELEIIENKTLGLLGDYAYDERKKLQRGTNKINKKLLKNDRKIDLLDSFMSLQSSDLVAKRTEILQLYDGVQVMPIFQHIPVTKSVTDCIKLPSFHCDSAEILEAEMNENHKLSSSSLTSRVEENQREHQEYSRFH